LVIKCEHCGADDFQWHEKDKPTDLDFSFLDGPYHPSGEEYLWERLYWTTLFTALSVEGGEAEEQTYTLTFGKKCPKCDSNGIFFLTEQERVNPRERFRCESCLTYFDEEMKEIV